MLHIADAANKSHRKIMNHGNDSDVVQKSVAIMYHIDIDELWIAFGTGQNFR